MSRTRIDWATDTINCITGCLNCDKDGYCQGKFKCYAEGFAKRLAGKERKYPGSTGYPTEEGQHFRPTFHPDKLQDIYNLRGAHKRVFLDSMGDWFSPGVDRRWIVAVLKAIETKPNIDFLVLSKSIERFPQLIHCDQIPQNLWIGVTVIAQKDVQRIDILRRVLREHTHKFVSFEPLHGPISADLSGIGWVIIGAETGNRKGKIEPKEEWVESIFECSLGDVRGKPPIPVFMKDNLMPYLLEWSQIRDFPKEMLS